MSTLNHLRRLLQLLLCLPAMAVAQAIPGYPDAVTAYDPREVAMLPTYCRFAQGFREKVPGGANREQIDRWRQSLGPTFEHIHHYCWGLMKSNRGGILARTSGAREAYLRDANREFEYVLDRAGEDFILLPEILTRRGENQIRLGRGQLALVDLERAVLLKPDYWPAYAQMADFYRGNNQVEEAREVLNRGLAAAPQAQALKRRLDDLKSERKPK